ncbi:glycosyltransferase [Candidatus Woesearchaeota archaeon]|nr:glycosyltransferase [Candidatus Woesearchaeota archaeon]
MEKNKVKLSIVIPVLNEGVNLRVLLRILKAIVDIPNEVLVVYDMPSDDSIPVVELFQKKYSGLKPVHNQLGRGVITAIKSGVANAAGDYILIIAADDIGPVLAIEDMVALMDEGCDLVNATRYAYGGKNIGGSFASKVFSRVSNKLFYFLSGCGLTDPTFGVKMFRRSLFNTMQLESKPVGWAVSFEFAIKAQLAGWKLGEVPLISLNRLYGEGKSSFRLNWLREYLKWFFWGVRRLFLFGKTKSKISVKIPEKMRHLSKKQTR